MGSAGARAKGCFHGVLLARRSGVPVVSRLTPKISELPIEPLQQLVQFGNKEIQDSISAVMQLLQVQQSRASNRNILAANEFAFARQYYSRISEALEIYARANLLFAYSRRTTEEAPQIPSRDEMFSAATQCGFWQPKWEQLEKFIYNHWRPFQPTPYHRVQSSPPLSIPQV